MSATVLVCVAHPDDEVLGCGGTMARHAAAGDAVHMVFMADGVFSRQRETAALDRDLERRRGAAAKAAEILGARPPRALDFPDQRLDTVPFLELAQAVEGVAREINPTVVYTHHSGDLNLDHRLVAEAVMTAFRPMPGQSVRAIYGFETLSSTGWSFSSREPTFGPGRFVGIEAHLKQKLDALHAYADEMRPFPHARSYEAVEALARYRGASVGLTAAEAFTVLRQIEA